jgi:uncharacterized protein
MDVRRVAAELRIPSADKPAMPCLASRLPYGTTVDPDALAQIDRAETALRALGYRDLRVRHLGRLGRVELGESDLALIRTRSDRQAVVRAVTSSGFVDVEIDDRPLRSGSFTGLRPIPLSIA